MMTKKKKKEKKKRREKKQKKKPENEDLDALKSSPSTTRFESLNIMCKHRI